MFSRKRAVEDDRYFVLGTSDSGSNPDTPVIMVSVVEMLIWYE